MMTTKCKYCGKSFPTAKGAHIHEANCPSKDPLTRMNEAQDKMSKAQRKFGRML